MIPGRSRYRCACGSIAPQAMRSSNGRKPGHVEAWRLERLDTPGLSRCSGIKASGICRLLLAEMDEEFSLYVTPINIDPDRPAMPISHPSYYATYMARRIGRYATLGLAEDTWALNEGVISDEASCSRPTTSIASGRTCSFAALERLRSGVLVCVFDATDRIQHMFWRHLECDPDGDAIGKLYERNDALIGRVMDRMQPEDVLMVLSDHGFAPFRRGVNINAWLTRPGLPGAQGRNRRQERVACRRRLDTDARVRARSHRHVREPGGARGRRNREAGIRSRRIEGRIIARLRGLIDPDTGEVGITEVFDTATLYSGPYLANAPDFIVGYNSGVPHLVGLGNRRRCGCRLSGQPESRGAAITRSIRGSFRACSSPTARSMRAIPHSSTSPQQPCGCSGSSRRLHGREAALSIRRAGVVAGS
jgi:hypothetical protein